MTNYAAKSIAKHNMSKQGLTEKLRDETATRQTTQHDRHCRCVLQTSAMLFNCITIPFNYFKRSYQYGSVSTR